MSCFQGGWGRSRWTAPIKQVVGDSYVIGRGAKHRGGRAQVCLAAAVGHDYNFKKWRPTCSRSFCSRAHVAFTSSSSCRVHCRGDDIEPGRCASSVATPAHLAQASHDPTTTHATHYPPDHPSHLLHQPQLRVALLQAAVALVQRRLQLLVPLLSRRHPPLASHGALLRSGGLCLCGGECCTQLGRHRALQPGWAGRGQSCTMASESGGCAVSLRACLVDHRPLDSATGACPQPPPPSRPALSRLCNCPQHRSSQGNCPQHRNSSQGSPAPPSWPAPAAAARSPAAAPAGRPQCPGSPPPVFDDQHRQRAESK